MNQLMKSNELKFFDLEKLLRLIKFYKIIMILVFISIIYMINRNIK